MKPTLPVRRLFDPDAPNYVRVTTPEGNFGIRLTGDWIVDETIRDISNVAEGYGINGLAPMVIIRKIGK